MKELNMLQCSWYLNRPQFESEEDSYIKFQQKMADTNVGFVGDDARKTRQKGSTNHSSFPVIHTESCTLHDKILAKYVRYKEEAHMNSNNKQVYGNLYTKRIPSNTYNDPSDLKLDLQPTVMGLRRIYGTNQPADKYYGNTNNHSNKYQHYLIPLKHNQNKQTKRPHEEEPEIELFSSKSLRRTKGSILTSPRSNRLLGKTRNSFNSTQSLYNE